MANKENDRPKNWVELRNGVHMPLVGLGTSHSGGYSHSSVVYALKECGYRLIDTAKRYGTEEFIPLAIKESGVPRSKVFLITKLWPTDYGFESTRQALRGSLKRLDIDQLDLFLIHYPEVSSSCANKWDTLAETWRALESLYDDGLIRAIGVSNYTVEDLERQAADASVTPFVNQIEFHPYQYPKELLQYCFDHGIQPQGYCPLGMGNLVSDESVVSIASSVGRSAAQVLIRWSVQHRVPTVPKSTKMERVRENIGVFDFDLSPDQMRVLDSLHRNVKYQDVATIREKIDQNLPDGYKLDASLREKILLT